MSYPGSFFQEEAEETQAVPKARPNRRTSRVVPATNPGVTPQQQLENAQALAVAQLVQQQRQPGHQWGLAMNFNAIPGQPNVNVATQDEQDSEEAPPLPRGSRLEAKRVAEVFDPLTPWATPPLRACALEASATRFRATGCVGGPGGLLRGAVSSKYGC